MLPHSRVASLSEKETGSASHHTIIATPLLYSPLYSSYGLESVGQKVTDIQIQGKVYLFMRGMLDNSGAMF